MIIVNDLSAQVSVRSKAILLGVISVSCMASSTQVFAQGASQDQQEESNETLPSDEDTNQAIEQVIEEEVVEDTIEPNWYVDMNFTTGRRWYKHNNFSSELLQFTTEWSYKDVPFRFGSNISYARIKFDEDTYNDASLIELAFRATTFYEFDKLLPYVSVDYTFLSSGSVKYEHRTETQAQDANYDLSSTGATLSIGANYALGSIIMTIEASLFSSIQIKQEGDLNTATLNGNSNTITTEKDKTEIWDRSQTILLGVGFEL